MKRKIIFSIITIFIGIIIAPAIVSADHNAQHTEQSSIQSSFNVRQYLKEPSATGNTAAQAPEQDIFQFIADTIDFLTAIIGSFSLLVFIVGALYMLVSEGQEDRLQKGKQAMVYALIGLAIALFAYVITTAVQSVFF